MSTTRQLPARDDGPDTGAASSYHLTRFALGGGRVGMQITPQGGRFIQLDAAQRVRFMDAYRELFDPGVITLAQRREELAIEVDALLDRCDTARRQLAGTPRWKPWRRWLLRRELLDAVTVLEYTERVRISLRSGDAGGVILPESWDTSR